MNDELEDFLFATKNISPCSSRPGPRSSGTERRAGPAGVVGHAVLGRADDDLPLGAGGGEGGSNLAHHAQAVWVRVGQCQRVKLC